MNKAIFLIFIFVTATTVLSGCRTNSTEPSQVQLNIHNLDKVEYAIVSSDNSFGFKLFSQINGSEQNKNVFISPFSVSMAFGMLLNGANGSTLDSLEQALGDAGMSLSDINNAYKNVSVSLTTLDAHVTFQNANSIWYRDGFPVLTNFLNVNKNYFDAEVNSLNFNLPSTAQTINNWVNLKTYGKIPTILDGSIPSDIVMYLINAIYFKGAWTYKFDTSGTKDASFTCADGSIATCKLMNQEDTFAYYADSSMQAIDLPYGDRSYSMTVILPSAGISIDQFASALSQSQWNTIINKLDSAKVDLYMPKFTLNYSRVLNNELKALGMGIAFDPLRADLTRISAMGGLYVSYVLHKTYVDVDEEGTEAAAATVIGIEIGAVYPGRPEINVMRIDHPFIFVIREHQSGTILFIGKIVNPASS
jgi:serine protease inhibitor